MIENNIIFSLITDEDYTRKVLPFVKEEFFSTPQHKLLFKLSMEYFDKYNQVPQPQVLSIELNEGSNVDQTTIDNALQFLNLDVEPVNEQWLLDETEKFCQDKAIYNLSLIHI